MLKKTGEPYFKVLSKYFIGRNEWNHGTPPPAEPVSGLRTGRISIE